MGGNCVAARGIDVPGISHVINFGLSKAAEDYVHRIGRAARVGSSGIAVSFASNRYAGNLQKFAGFLLVNFSCRQQFHYLCSLHFFLTHHIVHFKMSASGFYRR
ncbi:protein of unknown function [Candidatus Nitrotoga arctica]|uniref:Helicase C-terminal domain-containing protein n=1 Tax=Candidatus Nitrotoga arctica TaxID=453162 RepID=A0ABN8AN53_9PROT|nr:protein of unknown function [Candidatus Nitrotoga arctica]